MPEYTIPMFGVIRLTFEREGGSIKGDDDFFSVARTMPFVATRVIRILCKSLGHDIWQLTFDAQGSNTLVDGI
jgi:hypothetical protein